MMKASRIQRQTPRYPHPGKKQKKTVQPVSSDIKNYDNDVQAENKNLQELGALPTTLVQLNDAKNQLDSSDNLADTSLLNGDNLLMALQHRSRNQHDKAIQMSKLLDYKEAQPEHDPSKISDAQIQATSEYKAFMNPMLVWQWKDKVNSAEALMACKLILRALRQGQTIQWETDARIFLRQARSQLRVSLMANSMLGKEATWVPSGPGSGDTFASWAEASSEGSAPLLKASTKINCWEVVLLAAYRAKKINWQWIHDLYTSTPVSDWISQMAAASLNTHKVDDPDSPLPLKGDIVFMDGLAHVALATGVKDEVYTFWPPPDKPSYSDTVDKVKIRSIKSLSDYMKATWGKAPKIEFASPSW